MNQNLLGNLIDSAEDDDSITIFFENRNINLLKKVINSYQFYNRGYHLQIVANAGKRTILIKTDSIQMATLVKPTGKKMTWYNQGQGTKAGA